MKYSATRKHSLLVPNLQEYLVVPWGPQAKCNSLGFIFGPWRVKHARGTSRELVAQWEGSQACASQFVWDPPSDESVTASGSLPIVPYPHGDIEGKERTGLVAGGSVLSHPAHRSYLSGDTFASVWEMCSSLPPSTLVEALVSAIGIYPPLFPNL